MTATLAFDIETVPDIAGIRRAHAIAPSVEDAGVLDWITQQRRAQTGGDFLAPAFHRIVAIACVLRDESTLRVWSLGEAGDPEAELLRRFCDGIERYTPQLVSWNGGGFDLPVIHHRCMVHGVCAPRYWDWGDEDKDFRYNNYLGRYHTRHLDVMDVLAMYQPRAYAGLDAMARLCGFPGKLGMDGGVVHAAVRAGRIDDVRRYCETDVMNTYLLYLRFRLIRGSLSAGEYATEVSLVRDKIAASGAPHWQQFLAAWDDQARTNGSGA
jgi:predicted PolB exonuclease-like 3'-5' exonuclease